MRAWSPLVWAGLSLGWADAAFAQDTFLYYDPTVLRAGDVEPLTWALEDAGADVYVTNVAIWPTRWNEYRLVILLLPGADFSPAQAESLEAYVNDGGRLVVTGDHGMTPGFGAWNNRINILMVNMHVGMWLNSATLAAPPSGYCGYNLYGIQTDSLTGSVAYVEAATGSGVTGGKPLITFSSQPIVAVDQPTTSLVARAPYDVVLSGDTHIFLNMCRSSWVPGSNLTFWRNLYEGTCRDRDGDSFKDANCGGLDCNDADPEAHPGGTEVCNDADDDCDGVIDDAAEDAPTWYADADADGFGNLRVTREACRVPTGYVGDYSDCDDARRATRPGAIEMCNGIDEDCDGTVDEEPMDGSLWNRDADGDSFGNPASRTLACVAPAGYVRDGTDCNDALNSVYPGADERCNARDDDCDGSLDEAAIDGVNWYRDGDGDLFGNPAVFTQSCTAPTGYVGDGTDCDDARRLVHPGVSETCNGSDDDCDGNIDEAASDASLWFADADRDGYGNPLTRVVACEGASGAVANSSDCDDANPLAYPGATETPYDGVDQDCDRFDLRDVDGDGFVGRSAGGTDCWDASASTYPGAAEIPDGVDQDCDGQVDEGTRAFDDDGDGVSEVGGDCNDADRTVFPAALEVEDLRDNDCDGRTDEGTSAFDDDGDGWSEHEGDCNDVNAAIFPGTTEVPLNGLDDDCDGIADLSEEDPDRDGWLERGGDCDEGNAARHPGAVESDNGLDDDCDGLTDEGTGSVDDDLDGAAESEGDCDDDDPMVGPGAPEITNGRDDDCDGKIDEETNASDDDGDGFSEYGGDCDDADATVFPGAVEADDERDDDCDGDVDEGVSDLDADGVSAVDGDCDDKNPWVTPTRAEQCDGLDNDCDGSIDESACGDATADVTTDGAGCGCMVSPNSTSRSGASWVAAILGLSLWRQRRTRRRA